MALIATLTKQDGAFTGAISTLTLKTKITISPVEKSGEKAPGFRVCAGAADIGAAWSATSKEGNATLSVKLDEPSFAAPILCRPVETDKGHALVWNRQ